MTAPRRVSDLHPGSGTSFPNNLTAFGNALFFSANDGSSGYQLWKSDGSAAGTTRITDIRQGSTSAYPTYLTPVGQALFFTAVSSGKDNPSSIWKTDGTSAGTTLVRVSNPGKLLDGPQFLTAVGHTLFFSGTNDVGDRELWKSNGDSTTLVKDINPGFTSGGYGPPAFYSSGPRDLAAFGNTLFFSADDGKTGLELWKSDGTAAGTTQVKDIRPGNHLSGSIPSNFTAIGKTLFFGATEEGGITNLWKSDGTTAGTVRVTDPNSGSAFSSPGDLTAVGNSLFFTANDGKTSFGLWKSDGTAAGTVRVADLNPGNAFSSPVYLTAVGNNLFFTADDGKTGFELWKSDGTAAGTVRVADLNPGSAFSSPGHLTAVGNNLFFTANDGKTGFELWKSDGTAAGTVRVADLNPGSASSNPRELTAVGNTLFFSADDGSSGRELWALDVEPEHYLCFSGGGWNTHSLLAGLFAGALDVMETCGSDPASALADLMDNVEGIAAISGGSWFLSHLAYSSIFNQQFDSRADRNAYTSSGYNGALARRLGNVLSRDLSPNLRKVMQAAENIGITDTALDQVRYVAKLAAFLGETELDWRAFVEQLVYTPLDMLDELDAVNLKAPRQAWAQDKDLVIATALSTSDTVLHSRPATIGDDRIFSHAEPSLKGAQARPIALRSLVSDAGGYDAVADDPLGGQLTITYSNDQLRGPNDTQLNLDLRGGIPLSPDLSIIDATVASSSALAALAQPFTFTGSTLNQGLLPKILSTSLRRLSPLASFRKGQRTQLDIPSTSSTEPDFDQLYRKASQAAEVRLMDGGYVDNAPAAYMLRQIQNEQGVTEPFDLTLFFNSSIDPITGVRMNVAASGRSLSSFRLPADLAQLFGRTVGEAAVPPGSLVDGPFPKLQNRMPSPQIFEEKAWRGESKPEWEFQRGSLEIRYFDLDVTTVRNRQFGITGGQSGRVRIFASNNADSFAAPVQQSILNEYNTNYLLSRRAIRQFGGAEYMLDALGVAETSAAS